MTTYASLYKVNGLSSTVMVQPPVFNSGDVIQFCSEVSPGEHSGAALAVVLGRQGGEYEIELLGAEDVDYGKYISDRSIVPKIRLVVNSGDLHKETSLEMICGICRVGDVRDDLDWKQHSWLPRHPRNPAGKVLTKLRASMGPKVRHNSRFFNSSLCFWDNRAWVGGGGS